jgi:hypothetical protein
MSFNLEPDSKVTSQRDFRHSKHFSPITSTLLRIRFELFELIWSHKHRKHLYQVLSKHTFSHSLQWNHEELRHCRDIHCLPQTMKFHSLQSFICKSANCRVQKPKSDNVEWKLYIIQKGKLQIARQKTEIDGSIREESSHKLLENRSKRWMNFFVVSGLHNTE